MGPDEILERIDCALTDLTVSEDAVRMGAPPDVAPYPRRSLAERTVMVDALAAGVIDFTESHGSIVDGATELLAANYLEEYLHHIGVNRRGL